MKHGQTGTRLHTIWKSMKGRCNTPTNSSYSKYGAKGIRVCDEWLSFIPFYNWAMENGYQDNLTLDRKDGLLGYSSNNCKWESYIMQSRNRAKHNNNSTGYTGVYKTKSGKYKADICINYSRKNLGTFEDIRNAVNARNRYIEDNSLIGFKKQ